MITESRYWKDDLLRTAARLRAKRTQKCWPEAAFMKVEKDVFCSFFAIRKLIEAQKLSDEVASMVVSARRHRHLGKLTHRLNRFDFWELFDMSAHTIENHNLKFFCDQLIHSYIYCAYFNRARRFDGVLFASDRNRNKSLFQLDVRTITRILGTVGRDYPTKVEFFYVQTIQDYTVRSSTNSDGSGSSRRAHVTVL